MNEREYGARISVFVKLCNCTEKHVHYTCIISKNQLLFCLGCVMCNVKCVGSTQVRHFWLQQSNRIIKLFEKYEAHTSTHYDIYRLHTFISKWFVVKEMGTKHPEFWAFEGNHAHKRKERNRKGISMHLINEKPNGNVCMPRLVLLHISISPHFSTIQRYYIMFIHLIL